MAGNRRAQSGVGVRYQCLGRYFVRYAKRVANLDKLGRVSHRSRERREGLGLTMPSSVLCSTSKGAVGRAGGAMAQGQLVGELLATRGLLEELHRVGLDPQVGAGGGQ